MKSEAGQEPAFSDRSAITDISVSIPTLQVFKFYAVMELSIYMYLRAPDKRVIEHNSMIFFSYFSTKIYGVTPR